ncbi:hypothetical protein [Thermocatellispora tengchongensis]
MPAWTLSERAVLPYTISAVWQAPAAMASAAWCRCETNELPPTMVPSV